MMGAVDKVKVTIVNLWDHVMLKYQLNMGYWWLDSQFQSTVYTMRFTLDAKCVKYEYSKFTDGHHNNMTWTSRIHRQMIYLYDDLENDGDHIA